MATLIILAAHLPGTAVGVCAGFVLWFDEPQELVVSFRSDWGFLDSEDDAEVLREMETTLREMAKTMGHQEFVNTIETRFSNTIRSVERLELPLSVGLREHESILRVALLGSDQ